MTEETTRVAMLFPVDLKAQIQEVTGPRGMTKFVLDACREKLGAAATEPEVPQKAEKVQEEVAELKPSRPDFQRAHPQDEPHDPQDKVEEKPAPQVKKAPPVPIGDAEMDEKFSRFRTEGDFMSNVLAAGMVPASQIAVPPKPAVEPEPEIVVPDALSDEFVLQTFDEPVATALCDLCGTALVDGECPSPACVGF